MDTDKMRSGRAADPALPDIAALSRLLPSVVIRVHPWLKQKTHRRRAVGLINLVNESEPGRRAAQQRVIKQQIQIAIHAWETNAVRFSGQYYWRVIF